MKNILLMTLALFVASGVIGHTQAVLLMEQPYGFFGTVIPTGHNAIYFERICADTIIKVRRCEAGEFGAVIARYGGIEGYDWIAIPLIPYLYSVDNPSEIPSYINHNTVKQLRNGYYTYHLQDLGRNPPVGNLLHGGWGELVGVSYERSIYAYRFETTSEQDDALIAKLNIGINRSKFNLFFSNCADFARNVLSNYYPHTFQRSILPYMGITTPKQVTSKLVRYSHKYSQTDLEFFVIPQVSGYRINRYIFRGLDKSLVTNVSPTILEPNNLSMWIKSE